jgi:hypothetical protein
MKKYIAILTLVALSSYSIFAQDKADNEPADQFKVDVFTDIWLGAPDSAELSSINPGFGVGYLKDFPLSASWSVAIGGRYRQAHTFMKQQMLNVSDSTGDYTDFVAFNAAANLKRAKYLAHTFEAPVEFRWHSAKNQTGNRWKIAVGGKVGYTVNQYFKYTLNSGTKYRDYVLPDVNQLVYGGYLRLGIGGFGVYANYNFSPIFAADRSPLVQPLTIGITLLPR